MFDLEKVQTLNEIEMTVYHYILENMERIPCTTIRQLSSQCHVSTSSILRFCIKMDYAGFSELKYGIKRELNDLPETEPIYNVSTHVDSYLKKINQQTYQEVLKPAVSMIRGAQHIAFFGIGTSGILGGYGSRYFINMGFNSYSICDPFTPIPPKGMEGTLAILLSVTGETAELVKQATGLKRSESKILSITNNENSTIARLANYNISYYMPDERSPYTDPNINITTQIPVIALIEMLAHKASKECGNKRNP